jgi:hypothetical protein
MSVAGDEFRGEHRIAPALNVFGKPARERAKRSAPAMGIYGVANGRRLVRIICVPEDLENRNMRREQPLGGIAGVALIAKKKTRGPLCAAFDALICPDEFLDQFICGIAARSLQTKIGSMEDRSPDFLRFVDAWILLILVPNDFALNAIFSSPEIAQLRSSLV